MALFLCALIPLAGGALLAGVRFRSEHRRNLCVQLIVTLTSLCVFTSCALGGEKQFILFSLGGSFDCAFACDGLTKIFACLVALLWPLSTLYAFEYMENHARTGHFFAFYPLAYSAALLMACSANLFTLYIFYEFLTIITLPLVEHEQNKEAYRAGRSYLAYLMGGASLGFAAMVMLHVSVNGSALFARGGLSFGAGRGFLQAAYILGFMGFGAKAALFPLCGWLPKASVAPTPVTALLHAVAVVNAGVFSVSRLAYYTIDQSAIMGSIAGYIPMLLSAFTLLYAAVMAVRQSHLKKRLAWSTVSNLGYMLFALSLLSQNGFVAGTAHMVFHGLMKLVLFFCAGAIMVKTGKTDIHEMRGLAGQMPFTLVCFALAGLALTGMPPLIGFTSKYLIVSAALESPALPNVLGAVSLILGAVLCAIYIFTFLIPAYFIDVKAQGVKTDMGARMKIASCAVCTLIIVMSLFGQHFIELLSRI